MKNVLCYLILFLIFSPLAAFDGYNRYHNIDILHYEFALKLSESTDSIFGRAAVDLRIIEKTDTLILDLRRSDINGKGMNVTRVSVANRETGWKQGSDKLYLAAGNSVKVNDTIEIIIEYRGIPADGLIISVNKYGDRTFFADHWPDRAHNYLPCIDHPYDKATVDFIITAPEQYNVVANGIMTEQSSLGGHLKLTHWSENIPIPVKVMTFGAARFAVQYAGQADNVPVWSWVFPQNRTEGFYDYGVALKPLEFYSSLVGAYPFEKLANVQSKTIYGGLENAGAIFYYENSVTGQGKAEMLIAHEIAHQWFGDCVTEADWHHIWLSEGFATYLTSMYEEATQGSDKFKADMTRSRAMVIKAFNKKPRPIVDNSIVNLMDLLSVNSYQKGAWVLHMLRSEIGDSSFVKGLKSFYLHYRNSNVLSADFQHIMEQASGKDLGKFFDQWLYHPGQPQLRISKKINMKDGNTTISVEQTQHDLFEFKLEFIVKDASGEKVENIAVKERITQFIVPSATVTNVSPDPDVKLLYELVDK